MRDALLTSVVTCKKLASPNGGISNAYLNELSMLISRMGATANFIAANTTLAFSDIVTNGSIVLLFGQLFENLYVYGFGVPLGISSTLNFNSLHLVAQHFGNCGTPVVQGAATVKVSAGVFPGCVRKTSGQAILVRDDVH